MRSPRCFFFILEVRDPSNFPITSNGNQKRVTGVLKPVQNPKYWLWRFLIRQKITRMVHQDIFSEFWDQSPLKFIQRAKIVDHNLLRRYSNNWS